MSPKSRGVVERSLASFVETLQHSFESEEVAKQTGLLQSLDPRVKIVAILPLILMVALARQLRVIVALFLFAIGLALLSKVPMNTLAKRVWLTVLAFTGIVAAAVLHGHNGPGDEGDNRLQAHRKPAAGAAHHCCRARLGLSHL